MNEADSTIAAGTEIRDLIERIHELDRETLRVHHRIGAWALRLARMPSAPDGTGSPLQRCAALVGMSRYWLERHARACIAVHVRGSDRFEVFAGRLTARGTVLSPTQYLEHGAQRLGRARREWRIRVYGEDFLAQTTETRQGEQAPGIPTSHPGQ